MRRYRYLLMLVAVLGLAVIVDRYAHREDWRPLPDGGQIRLVTVTYERNAHVKVGGSIFDPLRKWNNSFFHRFLGPWPLTGDSPSEQPELVVWFTTRLVGNNRHHADQFFLVQGDKRIVARPASFSKVFTSDGCRELLGITFAAWPLAEPRLQIRFSKGDPDIKLDFETDNPCYSGAEHPTPHSTPVP